MSDHKNQNSQNHGIHAVEEDFGIKILKNGTWLHQGRPIMRHNLVKLFATVLKIDEKGDYWLQTPVERGRIEVEDKPFIAVELKVEASENGQNLLFRTNMDEWVTLDAAHPLLVDTSPYVMVRGGLAARLNRPTYYALMDLAQEEAPDSGVFGVRSAGQFFAVSPKVEQKEE